MKVRIAVILTTLALSAGVRADTDLLTPLIDNATVKSAAASLPQDQVVQALKEALSKGVQNAIARLGHDGGFLTNVSVKIQIPDKLKSVEKGLRAAKQDTLADKFIATMNHAAEAAIP